jgi:hypothetical protein
MGGVKPDGAIFLSAGVPDPKATHFIAEADPAAVSAAVSALLFVILGRRRLVWGGQPGITPMVWAFAESMEVDYGAWVTLYQSRRFEDLFPEETLRFQNVVYTDRIGDDIDVNVNHMRSQMLAENEFAAAVFIGGMRGILVEHQMFVDRARDALILPVASTGGAAEVLAREIGIDSSVMTSLDYVELFHAQLGINPAEVRYRTPEEQPADPRARRRPASDRRPE